MNSVVKNINNSLNIIFEDNINFYDLISELRNRLNIIINKSNNYHITLRIKNHLLDQEIKELEETLKRYNIEKFVCIIY